VSTNPDRNTIDVTLAKRQHRNYVSILKESKNLKVIELPPLRGLPDSIFVTDPAILGISTCIIGRFGETTRRGENQALIKDLRAYGSMVGEIKTVQDPGTMEGGDILVTEQQIFAGESTRTNLEGVKQLAKYSKLKVQPTKSHTFHMLCACSYLTSNEILLAPEVLPENLFPGFKFVTAPKDELYAAEALYLGERRVMIPAGYPRTAKNLKDSGYKPIETNLSEFYKGDGGVSCLSAPVYRSL
jgi:dimethylargininase